jgi:flagellar biosynthetic protein FlhB
VAEDSDLERTEAPSSRRLEQAREEGNVPQSRELTAFLVLLAGTGALWMMSDWFGTRAGGILRQGLSFGREAAFAQDGMSRAFLSLSVEAMTMLAPLFLLVIAATLLTPFLLGSWVFAPKALTLNFARLDPLKGFGRIFSVSGLGELVKGVLKSVLIGGVVFWVIWRREGELLALTLQPLETGMNSFMGLVFLGAMALLLGLAIIAALDVPFQLWQYYKRLRMTREEVRQENKELEGDPQLKARIRSQQREQARRRMMTQVPKADVVVTNPSHYAVALKYDSATMGAPQIVAKGINLVAARIREIAAEHQVPVLEAPPLARALYRHAEIGDQIPAQLYSAVAEVLAYVYQLRRFVAGADRNQLPPQAPAALAVPAEMDPGPAA